MSVTVSMLGGMRSLTGAGNVEAEGRTVAEVVDWLEGRFPGTKAQVFEGNGLVRRTVNVYVNGEDVRFAQGPATPVKDGDTVSFLVALTGG